MEPINSCPAKSFSPNDKKHLALKVVQNKQTITEAAQKNNVSRKFIHKLKDKAIGGIQQAFQENNSKEQKVLFYIPVTKLWLCQFILCLLLHCRSSFRGVMKVLDDAFDYSISIGTIHNISCKAMHTAKSINTQQDLTQVTLGAHDELFHQNKPILAGVDIPSLYCYSLSQEQQRDSDTWAIHLWDLTMQGFKPERVFADDGDGLRAGHKIALPHIPCDADHFHMTKKLSEMRRFFRNKLKSSITYQTKFEEKMKKAILHGHSQKYARRLGIARTQNQLMQHISESINTLVGWMEHDVFNKAGPNPEDRYLLFDFILDEFKVLAKLHPHRIRDVCNSLKNQRHLLLAFTTVLNEKFKNIALQFDCTTQTIWDICQLQRCRDEGMNYAVRSVPLLLALGDSFYAIEDAVIRAMNSTERTSSMVENLNSRLRPYLFLRREVGPDYLELLRFYLNHTPFMRSETHRAHQSPAELLTGKSHPHWLEMLGYFRFKRVA